jgi:hypothetical protein
LIVEKAHHSCPFKAWFEKTKEKHFHHYTKQECPNIDENEMMDHRTFMRNTHRVAINSFYQGYFQDSRQMVPDTCFGEWMDAKVDNLHAFGQKIREVGIWGMSNDEIRESTNNLLDIFLDNAEHCQFHRFIQTNYEWCMDNIETCAYHNGWASRIVEHGFQLAGNTWNVWNSWNHEAKCETDVQTVARIGKMTEGIASNISMLKGFESHWNLDSELNNISMTKMFHNVMEKKDHTPKPHQECPFKTLIKGFLGEDFNIIGMFEEILKSIFHPQTVHQQPSDVLRMESLTPFVWLRS